MALTLTPDYNADDYWGSKTIKKTSRFLGDTSYPTDGYPNIADQFGLVQIEQVIGQTPLTDAAAEYILRYDPVNDKMMVYSASDGEQAANTANVSDCDFRLTVIGY